MAHKVLGKDIVTPDAYAKVTGTAKYAADYQVEGMLFAKLYLSPYPHARVRRIDASEALRMDGVVAILTADDLVKGADRTRILGWPALTNEPLFVGDPILAVAAVDEATAAEAVEKIKIDFEPLPFIMNSLDTLRPGSPNPRSDGNVPLEDEEIRKTGKLARTVKWKARDFVEAGKGQLPTGEGDPKLEFSYGDLDAAFRQAALVLDETVVTQNLTVNRNEPHSALAYWRNGKLFIHLKSQQYSNTVINIAQLLGIDPEDVVLFNQYCGGGFASDGAGIPTTIVVPALLAKKTGRPVMLRGTRDEAFYYTRGRSGFHVRVKAGFRSDGRLTALDLFILADAGAYSPYGIHDIRLATNTVKTELRPLAMRVRGLCVFTNTPHRSPMRSPGTAQIEMVLGPILDKAARQLGVDRLAIWRLNVPEDNEGDGIYVREALDKGAALFDWAGKSKLSGQRNGTKVTGVGVGVSSGGSMIQAGFDGLLLLRPDGILEVHQGMGNLGTFSYVDSARVAAEVLDIPWEKVEVFWGNTVFHLPWNDVQTASRSMNVMSWTNYAAAMALRRNLQEIAAREFGGAPEDFEVRNERVFRRDAPEQALTLSQAVERGMALGGKYSGYELPEGLHPMTARAVRGLAGKGLVGVARTTREQIGKGSTSFVAGFARVELDTETGQVDLVEYVAVADCGTVVHPKSVALQVMGAAIMGFGYARSESYLYDTKYGIPLNTALYLNKPPGILDTPFSGMRVSAVDKPAPSGAFGVKGLGEVGLGAGAVAVANAISDALGGKYFNRTPITTDMILNALEGNSQPFGPLDVNVEV